MLTQYIWPDCSNEEIPIHTVSWTQADQYYNIGASAIVLTIDDFLSNTTHNMNEFCGSVEYYFDTSTTNYTTIVRGDSCSEDLNSYETIKGSKSWSTSNINTASAGDTERCRCSASDYSSGLSIC